MKTKWKNTPDLDQVVLRILSRIKACCTIGLKQKAEFIVLVE